MTACRACTAAVAEQPDRIFLGAPDRGDPAFEAILPTFQATRIDGQPCGLGQLLNQSDEQSDRQTDEAQSNQSRGEPAAGHLIDRVEGQTASERRRSILRRRL